MHIYFLKSAKSFLHLSKSGRVFKFSAGEGLLQLKYQFDQLVSTEFKQTDNVLNLFI